MAVVRIRLFISTLFVTFFLGCASVPHSSLAPDERGPTDQERLDPWQLAQQTCQAGSALTEASGRVQLKLQTPEFHGQFTGSLKVNRDQGFYLEVTHLFGGVVARVSAGPGGYQVWKGGEQLVLQSAQAVWSGIPLRWVQGLFLGRYPCPDSLNGLTPARVSGVRGESWSIVLLDSGERFEYQMRWNGALKRYLPSRLHWEQPFQKVGETEFLEMTFEDPERETQAPLRWTASSRKGEVKVQWRDRKVSQGGVQALGVLEKP